MRSILPSRLCGFCAFSKGSLLLPPSPVANQRKPSGPKAIVPPLWFKKPLPSGRSMNSSFCSLTGSATSGFAVTGKRATTESLLRSV
jgi:hypothetical protein